MSTHALYRFYDETGQLLYVGISADPGKRFAQHKSGKAWWSEVVNITIQPMADRAAALAAEREAIRTEIPRYNRTHNLRASSSNADVEARAWGVVMECMESLIRDVVHDLSAGSTIEDAYVDLMWSYAREAYSAYLANVRAGAEHDKAAMDAREDAASFIAPIHYEIILQLRARAA